MATPCHSAHQDPNKDRECRAKASNVAAQGGNEEGHSASLLDIQGVAERLSTSHRHIRRLVAEKRIPYVKVGHFIRFDPSDLEEWVADRKVGIVG